MIQRMQNGAAVKIDRCSKPLSILGTASVTRSASGLKFTEIQFIIYYILFLYAGVAELADALALGASGTRCAGSSPVTRTKQE